MTVIVCRSGSRPTRVRGRTIRPLPYPSGPRYGTVGNWPAFSWASRAALSPASWVASSFGTNLPELALGDVAAAAVLEVAALAASGPASAAPMTPPPKSEPAIAAPTNIPRIRFMGDHLLESLMNRRMRPGAFRKDYGPRVDQD